MFWKVQEIVKKVPKNAHCIEFCLLMKIFSISRRNSIAKMTKYMQKLLWDQRQNLKGSEGSPIPVGNTSVERLVLQCNPDSFLQHWRKNKWWGLPSHVKWCLTTSRGNCIHGWRWAVLSTGICARAQSEKKMQKWLQQHILNFIEADDWLSSSPDLNPLDYKLWLVL